MGTKRTITTETELDSSDKGSGLDDRTAEQRAADDDLQLALAEIGESEGRVQCIRTAPKDEAGIAGTYSAQEFSIERLRDEWGGGTYQLYFRMPNGTLKTKRTVQIIAKKTPAAPPDRTAEIIAALQNQKGGTDSASMLTAFLGLMQAQQKSTTDMIVAMIQAGGNHKAQGMGPAELVALLGAIQGLKGKGDEKHGGSLDELVKVLKIAKELGGEAGEGDGVLGKLASIAGPLLEKFADRLPAPAAPAPQTPRAPVPIDIVQRPNPPAPVATETKPTTEDPNMQLRLVNWLRETLKLVLDKAAAGKDPVLYADYVLDNLPPGLSVDVILPQLKAEDALDKLAFFDSRVESYREWLTEFKDCMVESIEEAMEQEAERKARENPVPPPPEVPAPDKDPVSTLYDSPNPDTDSEG